MTTNVSNCSGLKKIGVIGTLIPYTTSFTDRSLNKKQMSPANAIKTEWAAENWTAKRGQSKRTLGDSATEKADGWRGRQALPVEITREFKQPRRKCNGQLTSIKNWLHNPPRNLVRFIQFLYLCMSELSQTEYVRLVTLLQVKAFSVPFPPERWVIHHHW